MWSGEMQVVLKSQLSQAAQFGGIDFEGYPLWLQNAMREKKLIGEGDDGKSYFYTEASGMVEIHIGDWIVYNPNGRFSVMSSKIFDELYETVDYNYIDPHTGYRF